jgi:hypothetical protein
MVAILNQQNQDKQKEGRPSQLNSEDKVLMTLEYLREYRTYFHIAKDWGIHEATASRIIRQTAQNLLKSKEFSLPGKKQLARGELEENQLLASRSVMGEHIHRRVKIFCIFSGVYRNRPKRLALRFNLIAGLHNFELTLPKFSAF